MDLLLLFAVAWLMFGGLGYCIGVQKGRPPAEGAILGVLFGPLGVLVVAMLPTTDRGRMPRETIPNEVQGIN